MKKTVILSYNPLSNVGCEIITRGTIKFLERALPQYEFHVIVPTYHADRDRRILGDLPNVEVAPMLSWKRYLRAILRQTKRFDRFWSPRFASSAFLKSDLFTSVGGDIYTMFDGDLPEDWMGYESFATRHGIPSIMFGANMEKFEALPDPKRERLVAHLGRFKLLVVRDTSTAAYLSRHKVAAPFVVYPDPIFSLRPASVVRPGKVRRIGLNLSPLSVEKFGEGLLDRYAALVNDLIRAGYSFDFIPHVYSETREPWLDDRLVLHRVFEKLDPILRSAVRLREDALGFEKVSAALEEVDFVIAARMHCGLNALTLGKAVYFLEYSSKAKTMLQWVVNETPYAVARDAYDSVPADAIALSDVLRLIASFERLAESHPAGIPVDLEPQLAASPVWEKMKSLTL